jgi:predicted nucleic acid-binding protein
MIFVDTGAWYASVVPSDPNHTAATQWLRANQVPLLTTDFVLDETLTLLRARGHAARAVAFGQELFEKQRECIHYLLPDEIDAAWQTFCRFNDKQWSFTDCTSKVVMEKRGINTAFAFDRHFRQFGSVTVVP